MKNVRATHVTVTEAGSNVKGDHNRILGAGCNVHGDYNIISGVGCNVRGDHNHILPSAVGCNVHGDYNQINAVGCIVRGDHNTGQIANSSANRALGADLVQIGSLFGSGVIQTFNGSIAQETLVFGARRLTLRNVRVDRLQASAGTMRFEYGWHVLVYEQQQLWRDGALVNLDALFGLETELTLEWAEFAQQLSHLVSRVQRALEGADEPTDDESKACSVCLANAKVCVVEPCMHLCLCIGCARKITETCPLCRAALIDIKRVYQCAATRAKGLGARRAPLATSLFSNVGSHQPHPAPLCARVCPALPGPTVDARLRGLWADYALRVQQLSRRPGPVLHARGTLCADLGSGRSTSTRAAN